MATEVVVVVFVVVRRKCSIKKRVLMEPSEKAKSCALMPCHVMMARYAFVRGK
jgi:hypothetical protein